MGKVLEVTDLNIRIYDKDTPDTVVFDFDLSMDEGEIVGLVGESGSGKSMSALAIAGLLNRHDMEKRGKIMFEGRDLLTCPREELRSHQGKDIGIIFQEPMTSLNPVKKIGWQVEENLRIHTTMTPEERKERALKVLKDVELDNPERVYNSYPHQLSGGMRQRVMIASAMICNPKILIADEPSTALDVSVQAQILKLLKRLNRTHNTAILFISHDLSLVRRLCRRVLVMKGGYVVETGETEKIFKNPEHEYTKKLIAAIPNCEGRQDPIDKENILMAKDISVSFKEERKKLFEKPGRVEVLRGLNMRIKKGEILGLVGGSGCGKSTLAKAITGIVPYTGEIEFNCKRPKMVFQDPYSSLNPAKKVGWILEEPLKNCTGLSKEERQAKVVEALKEVGLDEYYKDRYPNELSGGQRQRVCIAQALMLEPELLIADEPVSALDVTIQEQIIALMQELQKKRNLSILFISHDLRVVYKICNYVLIMDKGQIVERGSIEDIYTKPITDITKKLLRDAGIREVSE
ncbi:MAG: ABC transporter ATP-binding protein [Lachnospiraceae bacterium]|nr:ABC transporter ATP-binding protein [Lachnospiraceae bacterium]